MAEYYKHYCGYVREIRRPGASRKGKYRKKNHPKQMMCPACQDPYAKFIKL